MNRPLILERTSMSRDRLSDFLQVGSFHILDVSFSIPPVLLPVFGFARCTLPQVNVEMRRIKEGNYEYPRKVVQSADVSVVTLEQGVSIFNSDFGDWVRKAVIGRVGPKNLLIVQFTRINPVADRLGGAVNVTAGVRGQLPGGFGGGGFSFEFARRLPGRAWLLKECRPSSYKPGTDFDGLSQDISIATLDIEYEEFAEFSLGI